ncbi:MAG: polysaccharide deacetylase family protein [Gemmatimonadales bacterium]
MRGRVLVLAYHNVVPDDAVGSGDRSLHLALSSFRAQLDLLVRTHDVVPIADVLRDKGRSNRPSAVITFDDGYLGAVNLAIPELGRRGLPATVFVAPGLLGKYPWWDRWIPPGHSEWDAGVRDRLLREYAGDDIAIEDWARRAGWTENALRCWYRVATEDELTTGLAQDGISVGCHSWSHRNLAAITGPEVGDEIRRSMTWIVERFPSPVYWLAYPYGLSSTESIAAARSAGLVGGFRVSGGWLQSTNADTFGLNRCNVTAGFTAAGFQLRTSGLVSR